MQLLSLPDELLSEILKHVGVADKVQHVQRCCMRFRHLLQQPIAPGTWGSIGIKLARNRVKTADEIKTLLQWLVLRQRGVTEVRVSTDADYSTVAGLGVQMALYALAGMLAPSHKPLYALFTQRLDIGGLSSLTTNALAATLHEITLDCSSFGAQHWATLWSLRSLRRAHLAHGAHAPVLQPPSTIQSMQLTSLEFLQFSKCSAEFAAPLLAHATALTALVALHFWECSLGTLPAAVPKLHQLAALGVHRCQLSQLPSLAPLTRLVSLQLPGNPALVDLRPALPAKHQLQLLVLGGTTPLTEATLEALRGLPQLCLIDVSDHAWSSNDAAALGYLVQLTHDKGCKLIT